MLVSCGTKKTGHNETPASDSASVSNSSVETKKANTDYKPAFEGQTRIAGVKSATAYEVTTLDSSLTFPWGIASLPDGRFIITERGGTMKIASASGQTGTALDGIPKVNSEGQGGLLGVCIDPAFEQNRMIYWAFSEQQPYRSCKRQTVGR